MKAADLLKSKFLSVLFSVTPTCQKLSVRIWKRGRFSAFIFLRSYRDAPIKRSQLSKISQFLGVV